MRVSRWRRATPEARGGELFAVAAEGFDAGEEIAAQVFAFAGPQAEEVCQGLADGGFGGAPGVFGADVGFRFFGDDAEAQEGVEGGFKGMAEFVADFVESLLEGFELCAVHGEGSAAVAVALQADADVDAPARDGGGDEVAHAGFELGPVAGQ